MFLTNEKNIVVPQKIFTLILIVLGLFSIFMSTLSYGSQKFSTERVVNQEYMEIAGHEKGPDYNLLRVNIFYPTVCYKPVHNFVYRTDDANNLYLFHFSAIDKKEVCPQVVEKLETAFLLPVLESGTYQVYSGNQKEVIGHIQVENGQFEVMSVY